jgi:hypothetical protein
MLLPHPVPMNAHTRKIFIPLDWDNLDAVRYDERLVAYQAGFCLLSELAPAVDGAALTARTTSAANLPRAHPAPQPCRR